MSEPSEPSPSVAVALPPVEWWPVATILPQGDGTWTPSEEQPGVDGIDAALLQIVERDGSLYDTVAWELTGDPRYWWLRHGRATFLGELDIEEANAAGAPVRLAETPKRWLQLAPGAACILDWSADVRSVLSLPKKGWIIDNPSLRRRVEHLMSRRLTVPVHAVR